MNALALTDSRSLTGAVEFYLACRKEGIQPILGLEVPVTIQSAPAQRTGNILLLAQNMAGWSNLCRISSLLHADSQSQAVLPFQSLESYADGLLCLSGGVRSPIQPLLESGQREECEKWLRQASHIFPERFYAEIQRQIPADEAAARALLLLARSLALPGVATQSIYYLTPDQAVLQRTVAAIRCNQTISALPPAAAAPPAAHFITPEVLAARYADAPELLAASEEIAARCQLDLPIGQTHYPRLQFPGAQTAAQVLRQKTEAGARQRFGQITPQIQQRLDRELEVIVGLEFESVFLIIQEILEFAHNSAIPTASRGSASSSLVAYCLGITTPDPLYHNLYFERFLNPARSTPPDIDTDICSRRRDEVLSHVFEVYGSGQVALVSTISRFRPRSALSDVGKAHGLTPGDIHRLNRSIPRRFGPNQDTEEEDEEITEDPYTGLAAQYSAPPYPAIFKEARALLSIPRHLSLHPGGLVITPGPLTDLVPVMAGATKSLHQTQLDMNALKALGVIKLDLLGIRGLTVLGDVASALYSWQRKEYRSAIQVLEAIPTTDAATSERIERAETIGCFQIESPGMRATLKEIGARTPDDLMNALALYRPGPLKGGLKDAFVRRYKGQESVTHLHPALESLLGDTLGIILYQEQVLRIAHELAGLTLAEADLLRRAMSHFDPGKQMQTLQEKFIAGVWQHSQVPPEIAGHIWNLMTAFAGYGFPKAHAASYAHIAWRAAWCKTYYPAEFMAAVLANWGGYYSQRVYLSEARRLGLKVRPPHINHARREFSVAYPNGEAVLYMGLDQIRDLTHATQNRILQMRPFHTFSDFLMRVNPRPKEVESLIRVGALDGLGSIPGLLQILKQQRWAPGQLSLFDISREETEQPEWDLRQRVHEQERLLGVGVDAHPLELFSERLAAAHVLSLQEAAAHPGQRVRVAGLRQTGRRSTTRYGQAMYFMTIEDFDGFMDVIVLPDVYQRSRFAISEARLFVIEGVMEQEEGRSEPLLRAERVWPLTDPPAR